MGISAGSRECTEHLSLADSFYPLPPDHYPLFLQHNPTQLPPASLVPFGLCFAGANALEKKAPLIAILRSELLATLSQFGDSNIDYQHELGAHSAYRRTLAALSDV